MGSMSRKEFLADGAAFIAGTACAAGEMLEASSGPMDDGLHVKFFGTGAAEGMRYPKTTPNFRRQSSLLVEGRFLIDLTRMHDDMFAPGEEKPHVIVYTHSHGDHYDPVAALRCGITDAYLSKTWIEDARKDFDRASKKLGLPMPTLHPLELYKPFTLFGCYEIMPLPGNHWTGKPHEQAQIYTIKKICRNGRVRLLYATDTSDIPSGAYFGGGFEQDPLTAVIMEATGQPGRKYDGLRISHSNADSVVKIFSTYLKPGHAGYHPPKGQPVYFTHMGMDCWKNTDLESEIRDGFCAPSDGLEVTFKAVP